MTGSAAGWFWHYPMQYTGKRIALCPSHAHLGVEWRRARDEWDTRRNQAARGMSGVLQALRALAGKALGAAIGKQMRSWEEENPPPIPPWHSEGT